MKYCTNSILQSMMFWQSHFVMWYAGKIGKVQFPDEKLTMFIIFQLCVVSLALFRTLIGLHCEDVMLQLVLR